MGRYIGPKWRINRRENATVLGVGEKWRRRSAPPGDAKGGKGRLSEFGQQLREKQKVKRMFGLNESQFRRFYSMAQKSTGNTGTRFLQLLEMRIDNVVYRLGYARTRAHARQMVNHGKVTLNGKKATVASMIVNPGDELKLKEKFTKSTQFAILKDEMAAVKLPAWLEKFSDGGKVAAEPTREMMDPSIKERLIIEYYSKYNVK